MSVQFTGDKEMVLKALHDTVYCSICIIYSQGIALIAKASVEYKWNLIPQRIARIWEEGCIIQSNILNDIVAAQTKMELENILLQPYLIRAITRKQTNWRYAIMSSIKHGIPIPSLSSTLAYFDSFRSDRLPANLIQAQRDYFGAHGFERIDVHRGVFFNIEREEKN
jgi:6-phosphogluconate dehydrogenase